ncbi:MAG: glycosyltransferase family 9 protein [Desulfovibrio sp.]|uniref:glycosyltransferase family 9 protein n=1 Tax=Desulfovibrio sp. TaxID=885 RepID=UPI001A7378F6|nr:glycosyltransferase family 9 protein [Desulfovibrio sp.]MBD5417953.1 glycosyltransferase family 9 protein [Desulfovibrio sp.]
MGVDVLVCNLTRFGDLLQSQPLMSALHAAGHRVGLLCLENFAAATPLLRDVDAVWTLPGARLMASLDRSWQGAAADLIGFARKVREESGCPRVLNLTPTLPARLLTRLLAARPDDTLGFGLDAEGFGVNHGLWATFLGVATRQRLNAPFNVVDMFRMTGQPLLGGGAHAASPFSLREPAQKALAWADSFLTAAGDTPPGGHVAFQLGASEARRQWPAEHFAALGDILWREAGIRPLLLGSAAEAPLAEAYARAAKHPFANAVGATDIPKLAALLRRSRLLVTNDTGTMHLAAGLGVRSLAFFFATAQPWDTGPYLEGCCCLEPALACHPCAFGRACTEGERCRRLPEAGPVARLALGYLTAGRWEAGLSPELCAQVRVWQTGFDADGFATVRSLSGHGEEARSVWLYELRGFWRQLLDDLGGVEGAAPAAMPLPAAALAGAPQAAAALTQGAALLDALAAAGALAGKSPQAGQLFLRNCERLQQILDGCAPLASLGAFWRELRETRGGGMDELLPSLAILGRHMRGFAARLGEAAA